MPSRKVTERARLEPLREAIVEAIALEKAYNVPALCVRLKLLSEATEEDQTEAFRSKRSYVRPMVRELNEAGLLDLAQRTLDEVEYAPLELILTEMTQHAEHRVSVLVRKDVLTTLDGVNVLFGDQPILPTLETIFGSNVLQAEHMSRLGGRSGGPITQHYIRNNDWSHQQMLEHCGALTCPQATFFRLLEAILHPLSRRDEEQANLAVAISDALRRDGFGVRATSSQSGYPIYEVVRASPGVQGAMKNLIFASVGAKPELVIRDAVNNDVEITKNADKVLVFDRPIADVLCWADLQAWWAQREGISDSVAAKAGLYQRLRHSVQLTGSPGELAIFLTYYKHFGPLIPPDKLPALIPQVYLHYDPYTRRERGQEQALARQRMDFLLLLPGGARVILEVDGQQHYATLSDGQYQASPELYASMALEDRRLRLAGYEVYRFGGYEFRGYELGSNVVDEQSRTVITQFFNGLFQRHGLTVAVGR